MEKSATEIRRKNIIYSVVLITVVGAVYIYRNYINVSAEAKTLKDKTEIYHTGVTMGVVQYNIKYLADETTDYQKEIDSLLAAFNQSLSTYIPDSEISRFNNTGTDSIVFNSSFFYPVLSASKLVFDATDKAFDPTVMPLVNAWGFGPNGEPVISDGDEEKIDSMLQFVGFDKLWFDNKKLTKHVANLQLDFSAIAKGYAVDLVGDLLSDNGIDNYMVEIGGELRCMGKNKSGNFWRIGIDNPQYLEKGGEALSAKIQIENRALATSGNYRNYYIKDGKRYAHTISPISGKPVEHSLLSASVFAKNCMLADAYATAFMVIGEKRARKIISTNEELEAILIYEENGELKNYISPTLEKYIMN